VCRVIRMVLPWSTRFLQFVKNVRTVSCLAYSVKRVSESMTITCALLCSMYAIIRSSVPCIFSFVHSNPTTCMGKTRK